MHARLQQQLRKSALQQFVTLCAACDHEQSLLHTPTMVSAPLPRALVLGALAAALLLLLSPQPSAAICRKVGTLWACGGLGRRCSAPARAPLRGTGAGGAPAGSLHPRRHPVPRQPCGAKHTTAGHLRQARQPGLLCRLQERGRCACACALAGADPGWPARSTGRPRPAADAPPVRPCACRLVLAAVLQLESVHPVALQGCAARALCRAWLPGRAAGPPTPRFPPLVAADDNNDCATYCTGGAPPACAAGQPSLAAGWFSHLPPGLPHPLGPQPLPARFAASTAECTAVTAGSGAQQPRVAPCCRAHWSAPRKRAARAADLAAPRPPLQPSRWASWRPTTRPARAPGPATPRMSGRGPEGAERGRLGCAGRGRQAEAAPRPTKTGLPPLCIYSGERGAPAPCLRCLQSTGRAGVYKSPSVQHGGGHT